MFKKLIKNKKAQQTAEYALLISLVVAAVIAMQTYAQRSIQAKIRDAAVYMTNKTTDMGSSKQYEPYYLKSSYDVDRDDTTTQIMQGETIRMDIDTNRTRKAGGYQVMVYCGAITE